MLRGGVLLGVLLVCLRGGGTLADPVGKSAVWMSGAWRVFDEEDPPGHPKPYPPKSDSWSRSNTTIMVSISSFRDYRCSKTLYNLFTKARFPDRVFVGVVQQNNEGDPDCLYDYCKLIKDERKIEPRVQEGKIKPSRILQNCPHAGQVRMMRVQAEDAKGPTYGRYLQGKLLRDEEFCMQIDAHMDFEDLWDKRLMEMWALTNNEYGVLTTYVPHFDQIHLNLNGRFEVPQVCKAFFNAGDRMVRNEQATNCIWLSRPKLTASWAAGFAFNKCHADRKAPYDPHLPSVFDGEEYTKFARLWTRGYDTYTPHRSIVFHDYNHGPKTKAANSWARKFRELQKSNDRLRTLLGMPDATVPRNSSEAHRLLGRWDLGRKRSLDQLIAFTGVDSKNYKILFDNCGKRLYVPFDESMDDDEPHEEPLSGLGEEKGQHTAQQGVLLGPVGAQAGRAPGGLRRDDARGGGGDGPSGPPGGPMLALAGWKLLPAACLVAFFLLILSCLTMSPTSRRSLTQDMMDGKAVKVV